jgi:predicted alpha/beta hydrolase
MNNVDRDNQKSMKSSHLKNHHSTEGEVRIPISTSALGSNDDCPEDSMSTIREVNKQHSRTSTKNSQFRVDFDLAEATKGN